MASLIEATKSKEIFNLTTHVEWLPSTKCDEPLESSNSASKSTSTALSQHHPTELEAPEQFLAYIETIIQ